MNIPLNKIEPKYFWDIPEVEITVHDQLSFPEELVLFNENLVPIGYMRTLIEKHGDKYSINVKSEGCDDLKSLETDALKLSHDILEILQCEGISDKKDEEKEEKTANDKNLVNTGLQEIKGSEVPRKGIFSIVKPCTKKLKMKQQKHSLPLHPCQIKFNEKYRKEIIELFVVPPEEQSVYESEETVEVSSIEEEQSSEKSLPEETLIFANLSRGLKIVQKVEDEPDVKVTKKVLGKLFGIKGEILYNYPENETAQYARCPNVRSVCHKVLNAQKKKYKPHVCLNKMRTRATKNHYESYKRSKKFRVSYDLRRLKPRLEALIKLDEIGDIDKVRHNLSKIQQEIYDLRKQTFAIQENTLQLQEPKFQRQKTAYQFEDQIREFKERIAKVLNITQKYRLKADGLKVKVKELLGQVNGLMNIHPVKKRKFKLKPSSSRSKSEQQSKDETSFLSHQEEVQFHLEEIRNHLGQARGNIGDAQGHLWMTDDNLENMKKIKKIKLNPIKMRKRQMLNIREAQFHLNKTQLQLNKAYNNLGDAGNHVEQIKKHKIDYTSTMTLELRPKFLVAQGTFDKGKLFYPSETDILNENDKKRHDSSVQPVQMPLWDTLNSENNNIEQLLKGTNNNVDQLLKGNYLTEAQIKEFLQAQGKQGITGALKKSDSKNTIKGYDETEKQEKSTKDDTGLYDLYKKSEKGDQLNEMGTSNRIEGERQIEGEKTEKHFSLFNEELTELEAQLEPTDIDIITPSLVVPKHTRLYSHILFNEDEQANLTGAQLEALKDAYEWKNQNLDDQAKEVERDVSAKGPVEVKEIPSQVAEFSLDQLDHELAESESEMGSETNTFKQLLKGNYLAEAQIKEQDKQGIPGSRTSIENFLDHITFSNQDTEERTFSDESDYGMSKFSDAPAESKSSGQDSTHSKQKLGYYTLMTLIGEVTSNYNTLREKRNEIEDRHNEKYHRSFHLAQIRNIHFYTYSDNNSSQPASVNKFSNETMKNVITESANILLLRKLATSTFRGNFKTKSLLINGKVCESSYEVGPRYIKMFNDHPVTLVKVIRTISFPNGTNSKAYTILTNKGRLVKAWWSDSGYKLIVQYKHFANEDSFCCYRPIPVEEYLKKEDSKSSFFKKIKKNMDTSNRYLHNHPEVMIMLHRYLRNVLLTKPKNVLSYTVCYFLGQSDLINDVKK